MSLLVVAYPELDSADYRWIQEIRSRHDELYFQVVQPHITFVLPASGIEEAAFLAHVRDRASGWPGFDFVLRCAILSDVPFTGYTHVFLVPDERLSRIVKLHDRLYTGILEPHLRLDLPYVPRIDVGSSRDPRRCKQLADERNATLFAVRGRIGALDAVSDQDDQVISIERIALR